MFILIIPPQKMSHIHLFAILEDPIGTLKAVFEIAWRLPLRVINSFGWRFFSNPDKPRTSVRIAAASAIFAPLLAHNWHLLLARPRWVESKTGLFFPPDIPLGSSSPDHKYGSHGYLYTSHHSRKFGVSSLERADAVWLYAHGGGFYAGEARQYHHTYMRWVDKAFRELGMDLRIVAVEYRRFCFFRGCPK